MILSITFNPSVDRSLFLKKLTPHDTNRVLRTETDAGGKGINVARVAVALGAKALATGFLGGGPGAYVRSVLDRENVPNDFVAINGETRMNFSIEDDTKEPPTTLNEPGPEISNSERETIFQKIEKLSQDTAFIATGGSIPPGMEQDSFATLLKRIKKPCVVDSDGEPLRLAFEQKPFMMKPNGREAERLLQIKVSNPDEGLAAAKKLFERGIQIAIVSLGEKGAALFTDQGAFIGEPPKVEVVSTIGSGDSLIGGFLFGLESDLSHEECLRWGMAAGAATAMTNGASICKKPAVVELLPKVQIRKA